MSIAIGIGVGLLAGLLAGMLGVGGGVILIPGMVFLMGVEQQHTAQGVSLAVIALMSLAGTIAHGRQENVRLRVALWIVPAAVLFAFIGGMAADMVDASLLRQVFGALLIVTGIAMVSGRWGRG